MTDLIRTRNLVLREMRESDARQVVEWRNSDRIASVGRTSEKRLTVEDHLEWFRGSRQDRTDFIAELAGEARPIGSVSYKWLRKRVREAELGKYIGSANAVGQGFGKEMSIAWLDYGFRSLGLESVWAVVRSDNERNLALNAFLGFRSANELESQDFDWNVPTGFQLFSLSKREWEKRGTQ